MIFVTVGTEKFPFERLIKSLDEAKQKGIITDDIFMQIGTAEYEPTACAFERFLPFSQMVEIIEDADVVISHAGIGSTLLCLHLGKTPIIFPRKFECKEHLDNHQLDFAMHIQKLSTALVAFNPDDLIDQILHYENYLQNLTTDVKKKERNRLVNYLRQEI